MRAGDDIRRGSAWLGIALIATVLALAMFVGRAGAAESDWSAQSLGTSYDETGFSSVEARVDGGVVAQQGSTLRSYLADGAPDPAAPPREVEEGEEGETFTGLGGKSFRLEGGELTRFAPDGTPDGSFGAGGTVKAPFGVGEVVELPSGKVALISFELEGAREARIYIGVTVLNADGSTRRPDTTVGSIGGSLYTESPIEELVPTGDGGFLVVGRYFLLKLGPDGSARAGFGGKGIVAGGVSDFAGAHVFPDGSIEVAGSSWNVAEQKNEAALFRYTAAGKPDASFGAKGVRTFGLDGFEAPDTASWGPDGSVVLGGRIVVKADCAVHACEEVPALVAFDPAGGVQTSFGEGGVLRLTALAGPPEEVPGSGVDALARRPDGSIVAAGSAPPNRSVAFLAALSPAGSLLPSFGEGGIVEEREPVPATERVAGFAPLEDGGVFAAANSDVGTAMHPVLVRYAADGSLDQSFGGGTGYLSLAEVGTAMGIAVNGEEALVGVWGKRRDSLFLRNTGEGSAVSSFGAGGVLTLPAGVTIRAVALAPDGDPVLLFASGGGRHPVVERFGTDGRPDPAFGHGGKVPVRVPGSGELWGGTIVVTPSGQILIGFATGSRLAVARLLPDGRLDRRFGAGGWSVTGVTGEVGSIRLALVGHKLYVAGNYGGGTHRHVALMRFDARGRPDRSFGHGGGRTANGALLTRVSAVEPTPAGVLVAVERGPRPLLTFAGDGAVQRSPAAPGAGPGRVADVQATVSAGRLIVGWTPYIDGSTKDPTYHLGSSAVR